MSLSSRRSHRSERHSSIQRLEGMNSVRLSIIFSQSVRHVPDRASRTDILPPPTRGTPRVFLPKRVPSSWQRSHVPPAHQHLREVVALNRSRSARSEKIFDKLGACEWLQE